jgi:hypothetical protein
MDLESVPDMEESLKKPLVELDVVDSSCGDQGPTVSQDERYRNVSEAGSLSMSPDELDSEDAAPDDDEDDDDDDDEWETESLFEEALHFVRDDQLSSCTGRPTYC